MTLEKLTSLRDKTSHPASSGGRRIPAALLPVGLALAFVATFGFMFGGRFLPALEVRVAPVITLRTASQSVPVSSPGQESAPDTRPAIPVKQALLFQASGWVEPDPYITNVPTLIDGVISQVHVLEGQAVKEGDLLATLIDDDAKLDHEEAKRKIATLDATQVAHCAELPVLNAEMHALQQKIEAEKALFAELSDSFRRLASVPKGSVSELAVEKARLQVDRQQAVIDQANSELAAVLAKINKVDLERLAVNARIREAQTDLNRKKLALERTRITSPMDGIVLHLHVAPGQKRMLRGDDSKSAVIVELYDPEKLQARIDVPLTEAAGLRIGQPVRLTTDLLPDAQFEGEVTRIVGEADLQRNTLQAKIRILDPDPRLRPEMLVRAEFYPGGQDSSRATGPGPSPEAGERLSIYAPKSALVDPAGGTARAWVVEQGRAQLREVAIGSRERDDHLLVSRGLRSGDQVILPPHHQLKAGKRIKIMSEVR